MSWGIWTYILLLWFVLKARAVRTRKDFSEGNLQLSRGFLPCHRGWCFQARAGVPPLGEAEARAASCNIFSGADWCCFLGSGEDSFPPEKHQPAILILTDCFKGIGNSWMWYNIQLFSRYNYSSKNNTKSHAWCEFLLHSCLLVLLVKNHQQCGRSLRFLLPVKCPLEYGWQWRRWGVTPVIR